MTSDTPLPETPQPSSPAPGAGEAIELPADVYARILEQVQQLSEHVQSEHAPGLEPAPLEEPWTGGAPLAPRNLLEAGLGFELLSSLILKTLYLQGPLTGFAIARELRLPFGVLADVLDHLKQERALEVRSGEMVGPVSYRYVLSDAGRNRARDAFLTCRYVGPAPVPIEQYDRQCRLQSLKRVRIDGDLVRASLEHLVLSEELLSRLGPAICSGQSIFLYGEPGNGKTMIARGLGQLLHHAGGAIYVPYALVVEQQVITLFDPMVHVPVSAEDGVSSADESGAAADIADEDLPDARWKRIRRPFVVAAGELTLEMLDLRQESPGGVAAAPLHLKANGGLFLLDDFGRQLIKPRQLLNRWILPLEEGVDYLTLATGRKFAAPFEQLIIFATNLPPAALVDAAFLRRLRHKIYVGPPTERQYREIFRRCCEQERIRYDDWIVSRLLTSQYNPQCPPKSSDPRDLLDIVEAICRFRGERPHLSEKIVLEAFQECVGGAPQLS